MKSIGIKKCIWILLGLIFSTDLAIYLNIPFARPILGFLFLTILPGLLILQILKLDKLGFTEKFVLSVGLSISFLMFFGLLLNNSSLSLGYKSPLSIIPLLISFNIAAIALTLVAYRMHKNAVISFPNFNLSISEKVFLIVPILFPALSIFGTYFMNTTNNNTILMFLLILIPAYVACASFFNQTFPKRIYPVVIFLISISLILMMALRSNHVLGIDAHLEYYFFQTTLNNMGWSILGHSSALDACLSITILPTTYQLFLDINPEIFFNIFYVIVFSFVPLIVFVISKKYVGDFYGFLSSIFFIFQQRFIFATGGARTNIAIFFLALSMMILFNDKMDPLKKKILSIIFMASCVISHYSTTYIFFFILFGTFIGMTILSKKYRLKKVLSLRMVLLFFSLIFFWYSQVIGTAFIAGTEFISNTIINLHKLFVEELRGVPVQTLLGHGFMQKSIPYKIEFLFTWITFAVIGIGVATSIRRYKEMSFPELNFKKPDFLKEKFEVGYLMIALICSGLLVAMIALPYISVGYNLDRLYAATLTILCIFFVIGSITLSKYLKFRAYLIILLVIIPYFFCISDVTYNIFGVPRAITLNSEGERYDEMYVYDQECCSAKWWSGHAAEHYQMTVAMEHQKIHSDFYGCNRLLSQGKIKSDLISSYWLSPYDENRWDVKGYFYLRHQNIVNGELMNPHGEIYNMTDYQDMFNEKNAIYDSGYSRILR